MKQNCCQEKILPYWELRLLTALILAVWHSSGQVGRPDSKGFPSQTLHNFYASGFYWCPKQLLSAPLGMVFLKLVSGTISLSAR